jgi:hypothetical protein
VRARRFAPGLALALLVTGAFATPAQRITVDTSPLAARALALRLRATA